MPDNFISVGFNLVSPVCALGAVLAVLLFKLNFVLRDQSRIATDNTAPLFRSNFRLQHTMFTTGILAKSSIVSVVCLERNFTVAGAATEHWLIDIPGVAFARRTFAVRLNMLISTYSPVTFARFQARPGLSAIYRFKTSG